MSERSDTTATVASNVEAGADIDGTSLEHLARVAGPSAPAPLARLRIRDRDLVICDGAGIALYSLCLGVKRAAWSQRTISYPAAAGLQAIMERKDWDRRARRLCLDPDLSRACRVPVGVVAAEARGASQLGALDDGEEAVYRLTEAAAAMLQVCGKEAARGGRALMADVARARRPSHVPLRRLQEALGEELALGRSAAALCSRSPNFSDSPAEGAVISLLYRRLGLQGTRDSHGRRRHARCASAESAVVLCEALDLAPEEVGL